MKKNTVGTSIIEAMVVLVVVTSGIVGVYKIYIESQKLSDSTENRIVALQIAREGIEAMTNIRDTNWFLFGSDSKNCWNTSNYDASCVGDTTSTLDIAHNTSFVINKATGNKWFLSNPTSNESLSYTGVIYRTKYIVRKDADGFYTQNGGINFSPNFTREIKIEYINTEGTLVDSNDEKMQVRSIVQWKDRSKDAPKKVELTTILTNWK